VAVGAGGGHRSFAHFPGQRRRQLRSVVFWAFGSFERAGWACCRTPRRPWPEPFVLPFLQKDLNLLLLGEERAAPWACLWRRRRWLLVLLAAALTGGVVALCGR
jgi:iron complex transport system permease protein